MTFSEFDLHPDLLDGIDALNFVNATPIQEQAIPLILEGRDLIGTAQTGTGKTAAFVLPILNQILESGEANYTQALVIVPTRELAVQIEKVVEAYSYFTGVSAMAVYGGGDGKSFAQEKIAITSGADILVATPGRLIAHINLGYVNFSRLRFLILDEADRMLDMGFQVDLMKIISKVNPKRQSLLFSATMPNDVLRFAKTLLRDPATISIALSKPAEGVTQGAYVVNERQKLPLIVDLLKDTAGQRVIIFGSTKLSVSALHKTLRAKGLPVGMISSDLEQDEREQVMLDFRNRKLDILVATDVLSRGIDVDDINLVINYDVPRDAEDYVHRIGRTARAGSTGTAITLIAPLDQPKFKRIETLIGKAVEKLPLPKHLGPGDEYDPSRRLPPREGGSGGGNRGGGQRGGGNRSGNNRPHSQPKSGTGHAGQPKDGSEKKPHFKKKRRPGNNSQPQQPKPE